MKSIASPKYFQYRVQEVQQDEFGRSDELHHEQGQTPVRWGLSKQVHEGQQHLKTSLCLPFSPHPCWSIRWNMGAFWKGAPQYSLPGPQGPCKQLEASAAQALRPSTSATLRAAMFNVPNSLFCLGG
eukprot:m.311887 g.311887  ORF g.311887 m.311887 type:complete len:127 (-) comp16482_c0_seq69:36-416(-)